MGLREHIHGLRLLDSERPRREDGQVAGERLRIARDVDDAGRGRVQQGVERAGHAARAGRIEEHGVRFGGEFRKRVLRPRLPQLHVRDVRDIDAGVRERRRRLLDRDHALGAACHQRGEHGDAGVSVHDGLRAVEPELIHRKFGHALGLPRVHLKERRGTHAEPSPQQLLFVVRLAGRERDFGVLERGLQEVVAGVHAVAERELRRFGGAALQRGERLVDPRRHQQALVHLDMPPPLLVDVAEPAAFPADGESRVIAVAEPVGAGQRGERINVEPSDAAEGVGEQFAFHLQLALVGDMLPLAAGAGAEVAALGLDAVGRCGQRFDDAGGGVASALRDDLRRHGLAGDAPEDERGLAVGGFSERLALPAEGGQFERKESGGVRRRCNHRGQCYQHWVGE